LGESGPAAGLSFDMDQETCILALELGLDEQIGLAAVPAAHVGENLLVEKLDVIAVDVGGHAGKEQVDKIKKESPQDFFDQLIVVDGIHGVHA
ncbi:MAG: hypothetical protein ACHRHE_09645, partial [Tepidisphaerales bacterium]